MFFQKEGPLAGENCEMIDVVTAEEFVNGFDGFYAEAKRRAAETPGRLIITAQSDEGHWIQEEIKFRGEKLHARAYSCNPKPAGGAEIPIE